MDLYEPYRQLAKKRLFELKKRCPRYDSGTSTPYCLKLVYSYFFIGGHSDLFKESFITINQSECYMRFMITSN